MVDNILRHKNGKRRMFLSPACRVKRNKHTFFPGVFIQRECNASVAMAMSATPAPPFAVANVRNGWAQRSGLRVFVWEESETQHRK